MCHRDLHTFPEYELITSSSKFLESIQYRDGVASFSYQPADGGSLQQVFALSKLVSVFLGFDDKEPVFHIHARVVERSRDGERVRLEFLKEERKRQLLVIACAEGDSIPYRRRWSPRIPCDLAVRATLSDRTKRSTVATNISNGGVHISLILSSEKEQAIELEIDFPDRSRSCCVRGRVVSVINEGPQRGSGLEFHFESIAQREAMATAIASLEQVERA